MLLRKVCFEEQLCIGILLVHTIMLLAIVGIQQMHRDITHQGDVSTVLRVEDKGVLHITLITVGLNSNLIKVVGIGGSVMRLSALTLLLHHTEATVEQIVVALPFPTILQVPLTHIGLIEETIIIHVMVAYVVLIVE